MLEQCCVRRRQHQTWNAYLDLRYKCLVRELIGEGGINTYERFRASMQPNTAYYSTLEFHAEASRHITQHEGQSNGTRSCRHEL